jgi:methionyl-tRNA synthetase
LLALYRDHPNFIQPESRRNEITSFVKQGLRDLSISRHRDRLEWGIPVPGDDDHVMYVWLDALTNYMTGVGYPDEQSEEFQKFWPADYHVIGKDIIRFHCIYWPAFLMAANLPLPKAVFAHGFINVKGEKMSKSVGNVLSPDGLVETYGLDQIRYFLMREIPHGQDGNFSHERAVGRINADLANGIGNLAQRTLSMIYKNCEGTIPAPCAYEDADTALLSAAHEAMLSAARAAMEEFQPNRALEAVIAVASKADIYVDAQAPWVLRKENPERMKTVLYVLAETVRCLAIAMQPVTPEGGGRLLDQLRIPATERNFAHIGPEHTLKPGTAIDKPEGVFPRIAEDEEPQAAAG